MLRIICEAYMPLHNSPLLSLLNRTGTAIVLFFSTLGHPLFSSLPKCTSPTFRFAAIRHWRSLMPSSGIEYKAEKGRESSRYIYQSLFVFQGRVLVDMPCYAQHHPPCCRCSKIRPSSESPLALLPVNVVVPCVGVGVPIHPPLELFLPQDEDQARRGEANHNHHQYEDTHELLRGTQRKIGISGEHLGHHIRHNHHRTSCQSTDE